MLSVVIPFLLLPFHSLSYSERNQFSKMRSSFHLRLRFENQTFAFKKKSSPKQKTKTKTRKKKRYRGKKVDIKPIMIGTKPPFWGKGGKTIGNFSSLCFFFCLGVERTSLPSGRKLFFPHPTFTIPHFGMIDNLFFVFLASKDTRKLKSFHKTKKESLCEKRKNEKHAGFNELTQRKQHTLTQQPLFVTFLVFLSHRMKVFPLKFHDLTKKIKRKKLRKQGRMISLCVV